MAPRWVVTTIVPAELEPYKGGRADPLPAVATREIAPSVAAGRANAASKRGAVRNGSKVSIHLCYNDEPDGERLPCVPSEVHVRVAGAWVQV